MRQSGLGETFVKAFGEVQRVLQNIPPPPSDSIKNGTIEYAEALCKELNTSLEKGFIVSRRDYDMYTIQDAENGLSAGHGSNCVLMKLVDGKLQVEKFVRD